MPDPDQIPPFPSRLCSEHAALSKAAAATSADAAAAALTHASKRKQGRKGGRGTAAAAEEDDEEASLSRLGLDIQAPCVEEIVLLQVCGTFLVEVCHAIK